MPRRLDYVTFHLEGEDLEVAFAIALELVERATRMPDEAARSAAGRIRAAGASRAITLAVEELAALGQVIDQWEVEAATVRRLRERLP
jgi:hypothetical protein